VRLALSILDLSARLLFALGVGCLLLGGYLAWQTLSFAQDAERATGEVVGYHETRDGDQARLGAAPAQWRAFGTAAAEADVDRD